MRRSLAAACLAAFAVGADTAAAQPLNCIGPQLGTWKLYSYTREDLATGERTDLFGTHPSGYISYGTDCRMSVILIKAGRKAPAALVPTEAERLDLYNGLISYAGAYSIDGDKVSHHIDASWNQTWTGTTQVRQFKIDGKTLHIRTMPAKNPLDGRESSSVLIWTKVD